MAENTKNMNMGTELKEEDILDLGIDFDAVAACVCGKELTEEQKAECEKYLAVSEKVKEKLGKA